MRAGARGPGGGGDSDRAALRSAVATAATLRAQSRRQPLLRLPQRGQAQRRARSRQRARPRPAPPPAGARRRLDRIGAARRAGGARSRSRGPARAAPEADPHLHHRLRSDGPVSRLRGNGHGRERAGRHDVPRRRSAPASRRPARVAGLRCHERHRRLRNPDRVPPARAVRSRAVARCLGSGVDGLHGRLVGPHLLEARGLHPPGGGRNVAGLRVPGRLGAGDHHRPAPLASAARVDGGSRGAARSGARGVHQPSGETGARSRP